MGVRRRRQVSTGKAATAALADWVSSLRPEDVRVEARTAAKLALLDCIGVSIAATREPLGRLVLDYARAGAGSDEAGVLASGIRTSAEQAAFANGVLAHALDYDDTWAPGGGVEQVTASHPTCTLLPALVALGEREDASGEQLLIALVAGYEVHGKLGFPGRTTVRAGFHGSAVFGCVGASAAAARLLGLDASATAVAMAVGVGSAGGTNVNRGTMAKPYQIGNVAAAAVRAGLLARAGLTGPADAIEGHHGFAHGFLDPEQWDERALLADLGGPLSIVRPGVDMKRHASCFLTHRAIDAALQIVRAHDVQPADVAEVTVIAPAGSIVNRPEPTTGIAAKFSLQYTVACAVVSRDVGVARFSDEAIGDPAVTDLMRRVRVVEDRTLTSDFPLLERPVRFVLNGGRVLDDPVSTTEGRWVAAMDEDELVAKFRSATSGSLTPGQQDEAVRRVVGLEDEPSIRCLGALLNARPTKERD